MAASRRPRRCCTAPAAYQIGAKPDATCTPRSTTGSARSAPKRSINSDGQRVEGDALVRDVGQVQLEDGLRLLQLAFVLQRDALQQQVAVDDDALGAGLHDVRERDTRRVGRTVPDRPGARWGAALGATWLDCCIRLLRGKLYGNGTNGRAWRPVAIRRKGPLRGRISAPQRRERRPGRRRGVVPTPFRPRCAALLQVYRQAQAQRPQQRVGLLRVVQRVDVLHAHVVVVALGGHHVEQRTPPELLPLLQREVAHQLAVVQDLDDTARPIHRVQYVDALYDTQQSNALLWSLGLGLAVHLE